MRSRAHPATSNFGHTDAAAFERQSHGNNFRFREKFSQKISIGVAELSIAPVVFFSGRLIFYDGKLLFCNQNPSQLIAQQITLTALGSGKIQTARLTSGQAGRKAPTHGADF